ncbi:MAG: adenylate kinase [Candidatus Aminicenantes bacterium]
MRIILLGPPGSGKGTQSSLVQKKYGFPKISTGDLLRDEVQKKTPLGKKAENFMNRGELVSDEIVIEMVKERIRKRDCQQGYVLDGFPRSLAQAKALQKIGPLTQELVIDFKMHEKILVDRLQARRICSRCGAIYNLLVHPPRKEEVCDVCGGRLGQRDDDKPEVIKERLRVYHQKTSKLIHYYQQRNVYHPIDGEGKILTVFHRICVIIDKELASSAKDEARR